MYILYVCIGEDISKLKKLASDAFVIEQ